MDPDAILPVNVYVSANGVNETMRGIPFPGTFNVDRGGRVKVRFFDDSYTVRNTVSNVRVKLNEADAPTTASKMQTQHLDVVRCASDAAVAPGNRFSIVADGWRRTQAIRRVTIVSATTRSGSL